MSIKIFNILKTDVNFKYTTFKNGLIFDINKLSNLTIDKINNLLNNKNNKINKLTYDSYYLDKFDNDIIESTIKRDINISRLKII